MANAPKALAAKPAELVELWKVRLKELRQQCDAAEALNNYTAVATLTRQVTQAEMALLDAKAAKRQEEERLSSTGDQLGRIVKVVKALPVGARKQLKAELDKVW